MNTNVYGVIFVWLSLLLVLGCSDAELENQSEQNDPDQNQNQNQNQPNSTENNSEEDDVIEALRELVEQRDLQPLSEPPPQDPAKVELGHNLFFDPILSGNKDANCAFCHQMDEATADEFSISAGTTSVRDEHGDRRPGPELSFTPRISPDIFNRGHESLRTMFWDARVEQLDDGRIVFHERSYPQMDGHYYRILPEEADNLLAAQNLLPVHDRDELRGHHGIPDIFGEFNEVAAVPNHSVEGTWNALIARLIEIEGYQELFEEIYPEIELEDLHFVHATNGLAAFFIDTFSFTDAPWDEFLRGDDEALTDEQARGAKLFYGDAGCSSCHGGEIFTDQELYNWGVPPKTKGPETLDYLDRGAAHRSHAGPDRYFHFRTPPLRNVELTGPYMHNGVYETLEDVIRHKIDPIESLWNYDSSHLGPIFRQQVHNNEDSLAAVESTISSQVLTIPEMSDDEISDLIAFLKSLTSPSARDLEHVELDSVPSGLEIPDPKNRPWAHEQDLD